MSAPTSESGLRYCLVGRYAGVQEIVDDAGRPRMACVIARSTGDVHLAVELAEVLDLLSRNPTAGVYYGWQGAAVRPWGDADFLAWLMNQGLLVTVKPSLVPSDEFLSALAVRVPSDAQEQLEGLLAELAEHPSILTGLQAVSVREGVPVGLLRTRLAAELAGALDRQLAFLDRAV